MIRPLTEIALALLMAATCLSGATWEEDFNDLDLDGKGAFGPGNQVDTIGVTNWTVDVSSAALTAADDYFRVKDSHFEARDTDGTCTWASAIIDITGLATACVQVTVSEVGDMEDDDTLRLYTSVDGGNKTLFDTHGDNTNDFDTRIASQSGLTGSTLQILIDISNSSDTERHRFDNILVSDTTNPVALVTVAVGAVWINEIHYDNDGADADEGVEIAGRALLNLSGYSLIAYNGLDGRMYSSLDLSGYIDHEANRRGAIWFPFAGLQNGVPDGIALVRRTGSTTNVVQFLSYEGAFTAIDGPANGLTSIAIDREESATDAAGLSLQLQGKGNTAPDFHWAGPIGHSRGALNTNQIICYPGTVLTLR